jgi:hypothetical protein
VERRPPGLRVQAIVSLQVARTPTLQTDDYGPWTSLGPIPAFGDCPTYLFCELISLRQPIGLRGSPSEVGETKTQPSLGPTQPVPVWTGFFVAFGCSEAHCPQWNSRRALTTATGGFRPRLSCSRKAVVVRCTSLRLAPGSRTHRAGMGICGATRF